MTDHKPAPRCPYCGTPMVWEEKIEGACWYECYKCGATAPTEETVQAAYEAAMQRWQEPNRVLKIGEVQDLAYGEYEQQHVLSVEHRAIIEGEENMVSPCVIADESLSMVGLFELYNGATIKHIKKLCTVSAGVAGYASPRRRKWRIHHGRRSERKGSTF